MKDTHDVFVAFTDLDRLRVERGLSVEELERWVELKRELESRLGTGCRPGEPDRRATLRVPTRLHCSFDSMGSFQDALITNLSRGGVFIATKAPLPMKTKLQLRIRIEPDTELEVEGEVVSHNLGPRCGTRTAGMGVRFAEVSAALAAQIDEACRRELEREREERKPKP